jgi:hypothetical protein
MPSIDIAPIADASSTPAARTGAAPPREQHAAPPPPPAIEVASPTASPPSAPVAFAPPRETNAAAAPPREQPAVPPAPPPLCTCALLAEMELRKMKRRWRGPREISTIGAPFLWLMLIYLAPFFAFDVGLHDAAACSVPRAGVRRGGWTPCSFAAHCAWDGGGADGACAANGSGGGSSSNGSARADDDAGSPLRFTCTAASNATLSRS